MVRHSPGSMSSAFALLLLVVLPGAKAQVVANSNTPTAQTRAEASISVLNRDGKAQAYQVELRQWALVAGRETPFQADGDLLFHVRAGRVTTTADGRSVERGEGAFWLVPSGNAILLRVTTEMATVDVLRIAKRPI